MSSLPRNYGIGTEDAAPLFHMTYGDEWALSLIWVYVWMRQWWIEGRLGGGSVDNPVSIWLYLLIWISVSMAVAMLSYIIWLYLLRLRYRSATTNIEIVEIVDRAKRKIGMQEDVEVWIRESDKLICMAARTLLFTAVLLSPIAMNDILNQPEDGEVVIAYKLQKARKVKSYQHLLMIELQFLFGMLCWMFPFILVEFMFPFVPDQWSFMKMLITMDVVAVILIATCVVILRKKHKTDEFYSVEKVYQVSPYVALLKVFGGNNLSEEKIRDYFEIAKQQTKRETVIEQKEIMKRSGVVATVVACFAFLLGFAWAEGAIQNLAVPILVIALVAGAITFFAVITIHQLRQIASRKYSSREETDRKPIEGSRVATIEDLLVNTVGITGYYVRKVQSKSGANLLAVFKSILLVPVNVVLTVPPQMIEVLQTPEMLTCYIAYEIKYREIISKYSKFLVAGIILPVGIMISFEISQGDTKGIYLWSFGIAIIAATIIETIVYAWFRIKSFGLDEKLARTFPQHVTMIRRLLDAGYGTPYMGLPLKKRLEHLRKKGFTVDSSAYE